MAISTKYLGATRLQGRRVKASCEAGSIVILWSDEYEAIENHILARDALSAKLNWPIRTWKMGRLNSCSWAHVRVFN